MSATMVQTEMLQQIKVESLVQVQFSETILKTNFETIIKILSALRQDMGQMDQRVNNVEGQCASISDRIGEVRSDMVNIKEKAKQTDASLKDLKENVEHNANSIDKLEKQVEKHGDTLGEHQIDIDKLKAQVNNINFDELKDLAKALPQLKSDMELYKEMAQGFANDIEKINEALEKMRSNQDRFDSQLDRLNEWKEMKDQEQPESGKEELGSGREENKVVSGNLENRQKSEVFEKPAAIDNSAIDNIMQELEKLKASFVTKEELKKDQEKQKADLLSEIGKAVARLQRAIDDKAKRSDLDKLSAFLTTKLSEGKPIDAAELVNLGIGKEDPHQKAEIDHLNDSIEMLQKALENLHRDFNGHVQTYDEGKQLTDGRLDALERQMLSCVKQDDLKRVRNDLKSNIDKNTEKIAQLENKLNELRILLNKLQGQLSVVQANEENNNKADNYQAIERIVYVKEPETQKIDTSALNQFNNGNWQQAIDDLRAELLQMIQALKDLIDKKADKDDLYNLEQMLLGKLDEVAGAVLIKLKSSASGPDTAKRFSEIEKKLFQMYQMLFGEAEDALVVKRPIQKWSCISCDKDLNSYKGKLGNYHNWAIFPPKETSPEKMGKFGQQYGRYQEKKLNQSGSSFPTKKIQPLQRNAGDQKLPSIASSSEGFDQKSSLQFAKTSGQGGFNFATPQKDITQTPPNGLNQS